MSSPIRGSSRPSSPDRKRSLEPESASDEEERTGRFKRQARGSRSPSAPESSRYQHDGHVASHSSARAGSVGDSSRLGNGRTDVNRESLGAQSEDGDSVMMDRKGSADSDVSELRENVSSANKGKGPATTIKGEGVKEETQQYASFSESGSPGDAGEGHLPRIMSLKCVVSTKEAGIIIGKQGRNVADIRNQSGAKVTISDHVPGAHDRIVTVTGLLDVIAKAYSLIARKIVEEHPSAIELSQRHTTIRILVPHTRMGSVIGKQGSKIKDVQDASGARITANEEMMPGSTERTVSVAGVIDSIHIATYHIGAVLQAHSERAMNNIPYTPQTVRASSQPYTPPGGQYYHGHPPPPGVNIPPPPPGGVPPMGHHGPPGGLPPVQIQQIFIPNEMVGAIIGKSGAKINEIRHLSGCQIKIAEPQFGTSERLVTITGTPDANQMALYLLYSRLEQEKSRMLH